MLDLGRPVPAGTRILVAMSGGVDSAVTAALLLREGFDVVGVTMRTHTDPLTAPCNERTCCSATDTDDARSVAQQIGIPFYALDLSADFDRLVIQPFVRDYLSGRTPNPCVLCNNALKLGILLDRAGQWGCEYLATGHYARVHLDARSERMELLRGLDPQKDQSYYLFGLHQRQLARFICPLGGMAKTRVRALAQDMNLAVRDKPESQEICFVPGNDYRRFIGQRMPGQSHPGEIVRADGTVVGTHAGVMNYTVGQRRGLGIAHTEPLYVIGLVPEANRVVVGTADETLATVLTCDQTNWVSIAEPCGAIHAQVRIRYRSAAVPAIVQPVGGGRFEVRFTDPVRAVTPGQAAVYYDGDRVLGGGWICR